MAEGKRCLNPSRHTAMQMKSILFFNGNTQSSIHCALSLIQKPAPVLLKVLLTLRAGDWALRRLLLSLSVPHLNPSV